MTALARGMITATEQSVAQNPAYRLATTARSSERAVFFSLVGVLVTAAAALHHARRLHQALATASSGPRRPAGARAR